VGLRSLGGDFAFDPPGLQIEPGDGVHWLNIGDFHTVSAFHPAHARLLPGVKVEEFLRRLRDAAGETVRVETTYVMDEAPVTSWDTELFRVIERTVQRHHPDAVVTPSPIPYGTDANTLRARGVGAYGFTPMVVSLDVVSSMHSDAERIPVTELRRGVRIFYEIVREFAGRDSGSG
jgi:acetylornithine deacetylase/succinyl-diaminopimelate desuccinylase-like protein